MRAAVMREYGEPLEVTDVDAPEPGPDGAVVEVEACGICRSDWHAWQGHGEWADRQTPTGQILGHEPAGRVVAVGPDVDRVSVGDRVAVPFNLGDGTCPACLNGHGNVCEDGLALGFVDEAPGAFAEQVRVPNADYNAMPLPEGVSFRDVAALGCRYMTSFHALVHRTDLAAGDWLAVHGCGGVGLSAIQIADAMGARVVAVDLREEALDLAREVGADVAVDASERDPVRAIRDATDGGAHVSMDALGVADTCRNSVDCLRRLGTHLQVGLTTGAERGEVALPIDRIARTELDVVGSRGMSPTTSADLLGLLASGEVDPGVLVRREVSLPEVSGRLDAMTGYGTTGIEVVTSF